MKILLLIAFIASMVGSASAQSNLPPCQGSMSTSTSWNNCIGSWSNSSWVYNGEFRGGLRTGYGILQYRDGRKYVGQFRGGTFDGPGIFYDSNGSIISEGLWSIDEFVKEANVQALQQAQLIQSQKSLNQRL